MAEPVVVKKKNVQKTVEKRGAWVSSFGQLSFGCGTQNEVFITQDEYADLKPKSKEERIAFYAVRSEEENKNKKPVERE